MRETVTNLIRSGYSIDEIRKIFESTLKEVCDHNDIEIEITQSWIEMPNTKFIECRCLDCYTYEHFLDTNINPKLFKNKNSELIKITNKALLKQEIMYGRGKWKIIYKNGKITYE